MLHILKQFIAYILLQQINYSDSVLSFRKYYQLFIKIAFFLNSIKKSYFLTT